VGKPDKKVVISNQLNEAVQVLTISEKRLLMLLITKVNAQNIDSEIVMTTAEYATEYQIAGKGVYSVMRAAQDRLFDRYVIIGNRRLRWTVTDNMPDTLSGKIVCKVHSDLKPHIIGLKQKFTQYYLRRAGDFKSLYSWRLFEKIMQFRTQGWWRVSVVDFKETLNVPKTYDSDFQKVRIRVINMAMKEIKAAGLPVKLETEKLGRSVHMLKFTFPTEQQSDWVSNQTPTPAPDAQPKQKRITKKYIEQHARPGESYPEAQERLQRELRKQQQEDSPQRKSA